MKTKHAKVALVAVSVAFLITVAGGSLAEDAKKFAYPSGRVGEIAKAYIEAFNTGDDKAVTEFHDTYISETTLEEHPADQLLWRYHHMYNLLETITPQKVVKSDKTSLVLLVKSESIGAWFEASFEVDDSDPPLLIDAHLLPAAKPK